MSDKAKVYEKDLYEPVKEFLEDKGFAVRSEVSDCDIMAVKGSDIIIVELKTAFNLKLLYQAIDRMSVTDMVYVDVYKRQGGDGEKAFLIW